MFKGSLSLLPSTKTHPNIRRCLTLFLLLIFIDGPAEAASSAIARITPNHLPAGCDQELLYIIRYFPGDGEAIVYTEIEHDAAYVEIKHVSSLLGAQVSHPSPSSSLIDYSELPIVHAVADTIRMQLRVSETLGEVLWSGRIHTSLGEDTEVTETFPGDLRMEIFSPLNVRAELLPHVALPDDVPTSFLCVVTNDDSLGRPITGVSLRIPSPFSDIVMDTSTTREITREEHAFDISLTPVPPGAADTLRFEADLLGIPGGTYPWSCVIRSDSLQAIRDGDELSVLVLRAPSARISPNLVEPGSTITFAYQVVNRCPRPLGPFTLEIVVSPGFVNVSAQCEGGEIDRIMQSEESSAGRVFAKTSLSFAKGDTFSVQITTDILATGMGFWRSYVHSEPIGQRTRTVALNHSDQKVRVIPGAFVPVEQKRLPPPRGYETDLDLVERILSNAIRSQIADIPLPADAEVTIENARADSTEWILPDILLDALIDKGYKVSVKAASSDSAHAEISSDRREYVLAFRMGDMRLICRPRSRMRFFRKSLVREVCAEYLLQLHGRDHTTIWTLWGDARGEDIIPRKHSTSLESPGSIDRTVIPPGGRLSEGLVALGIVGSIVFMVF